MFARRWIAVALGILALLAPMRGGAEDWPSRPIKFVVPFTPGGGNDILARVIGEKIAQAIGQAVVIENRPGAGGNIGADFVAKSPADGYTFLIAASAILTINPHLYGKLPYDPLKDFDAVAMLGVLPVVLAVNADLPVKSVKDLIALAKEKPDLLSYASAGPGTPHHLAAELFKSMTGTSMVHVPYKGGAPAATDLIAGRVQVMFAPINNITPYLESGRLRLLGVGSEKRLSTRPDLPTIAEAGVPGYFVDNWIAIVAPAGTPKNVVSTLSREVAKVLGERDARDKIAIQGIEASASSAAQLTVTIRQEFTRWGEIIHKAGIKAE